MSDEDTERVGADAVPSRPILDPMSAPAPVNAELETVERILADPVALKRAADLLGMCLLTEGEVGDGTLSQAEAQELWETETVKCVVRALAGLDDGAEPPETPTAVIVMRDDDEGGINVQVRFHPDYNMRDETDNPLSFKAAASFLPWLGEKLGT